jgi:hypothetical protein
MSGGEEGEGGLPEEEVAAMLSTDRDVPTADGYRTAETDDA